MRPIAIHSLCFDPSAQSSVGAAGMWPFMEPTGSWPPYEVKLSTIDGLLPGRSVGLDVVCDGILNDAEFIYPAELQSEALVETN